MRLMNLLRFAISVSKPFAGIPLLCFSLSFCLLGGLLMTASDCAAQVAGAPVDLKVAEGFQADLLYTVPEEQGSWVSITTDPQGRLITSSQYGGLYRVTLPTAESEIKIEPINVKIGRAQGLLCAFDSLYVVAHKGDGMPAGFFRVKDKDGDDQFDDVELLRELDGANEHGPHAVILGPDKKSLYLCAGNMTKIPNPELSRVPRHWGEDQVIPRLPDANGHASDKMAPGGWICKTDPDGKQFELICSGFRNEYDIAFSPQGELFTYDADMEWDVGLPWYRPTRVCHVVSGGEFGWRNGSGKWPAYYPDSIPATLNIGTGSPTGITFGTGAKFPAEYQNSLFISDWSYGIIYSVTLTPQGSSYSATQERFCYSNALPVTDLTINKTDGAMYFLIGGRRSQSALYKVSYIGDESTDPAPVAELPAEFARRHELEKAHNAETRESISVDSLWPSLSDDDRFIRYAARIGLEHMPVDRWRQKVASETDPQIVLESTLALIRSGSEGDQESVVGALEQLKWESLTHSQRLHLLRNYGLLLVPERLGDATESTKKSILKLESQFPVRAGLDAVTQDDELNRELSRLLIAAGSEDAVAKTVEILVDSQTQEQKVAYSLCLSAAKTGWTQELHEKYFQSFIDSANFLGGHSFSGYLKNIREQAITNLSESEKAALQPILDVEPTAKDPYADLKARPVVKAWTVDEVMPIEESELASRDLENGKKMFALASCYKCHRISGQGGHIGPDLTTAGHRFNAKDLLETIVDPSKAISDQYMATIFQMEDGTTHVGRVMNLAGDEYWLHTDMINPDLITKIKVKEIEAMKPSDVSMMPKGLLDTLNREDILDLMAYMRSQVKEE